MNAENKRNIYTKDEDLEEKKERVEDEVAFKHEYRTNKRCTIWNNFNTRKPRIEKKDLLCCFRRSTETYTNTNWYKIWRNVQPG